MPAIAQVAAYFRDPNSYLQECRARFGPVFTLRWPAMPPMVYFTEVEPIAEVFRASPDVLQGGRSNALLDFLTGPHSVARLDGHRHRNRRRELTSPFCRLGPDFAATMATNALRAFRGTSGRQVSFRELSRALTLRNLVDCTLGFGQLHTDRLRGLVQTFMDDSLHPVMAAAWICMDGKALRKAMTRWLAPASRLPGLRWLPFASLAHTVRSLDELLYEAIAAARQREGDLDLLSVLVASETYDGDEAVRDELMTMLVAGHETTATTMDWFVVETFSRPEVLARVQQEVREIVGDGVGDAAMVRRMPYLRAVINEVLRLHPPVPGVGRYVAQPTTIGGVDLPVGAGVSPCITLLHRNPDVWPDPLSFRPERFLGTTIERGTFIPFGGGTRTCLGKAFGLFQLEVVLATMLARFDVRPGPWPKAKTAQRGTFTGVDHDVDVSLVRRERSLLACKCA